MLVYGGLEERILLQVRQRRLTQPPDFMKEAPEAQPGSGIYLQAFLELTTCRPTGFAGPGPIPWSAVHEYAEFLGMSKAQEEELLYMVRSMDCVYLEEIDKKRG